MTYMTKQNTVFSWLVRHKDIREKTFLKTNIRHIPRMICLHTERSNEIRGLPIVHHRKYVCDLPPNHRFPMGKFPRVLHFLLKDQVITDKQVCVPNLASEELLGCVHTKEYLDDFINGKIEEKKQKRTGFPWSEGIVRRCRYETGGTVLAAELALQRGLACSTAGGTHHAFPGFGAGFCLLNDLAVAAKHWMDNSTSRRKVLIVDLDVHQGDGTAFIFQEEPNVFTFSVHCGKNFPVRKQQSDLDVSVEDGMEDKEYLETGMYQRDLYVIDTVVKKGIPIATVIGGGYSRNIDRLAIRHSIVHRAATKVWKQQGL